MLDELDRQGSVFDLSESKFDAAKISQRSRREYYSRVTKHFYEVDDRQ